MQTQAKEKPFAERFPVTHANQVAKMERAISRQAMEEKLASMDARTVMDRYLRHGEPALDADQQRFLNTLSTTTPGQGGYTVPTEVWPELTATLKAYSSVRRAATVIERSNGDPLTFSLSDGTTEVGELIAQNVTATALDPTFAGVTITPYKFGSKIITVPIELAQDAEFDFLGWLEQRAAERIGRIQNTYYTTGTGSSQPFGVVTRAASGKVGLVGQTTSIIWDDLVDLMQSVDPAYRDTGAAFMMNPATLGFILKIKDSAGQPLLTEYDGTLLNLPVIQNSDMPVMAANARSVLCGQFKRYVITDVADPIILRMDDSNYTRLGQIGFLVWARSNADLTDAGSPIKYYANSAT